MRRSTKQETKERNAFVEARLRHMTPIWRDDTRELFASSDGFYVLHEMAYQTLTPYIGITPEGEVQDLSGRDVDGGDIELATNSFGSAGLAAMKARVIHWPRLRD